MGLFTIKCQQCGKPTSRRGKACRHCGANLDQSRCTEKCGCCGEDVLVSSQYCPNCGSKLAPLREAHLRRNRWFCQEGEIAVRIDLNNLQGFPAKSLNVLAGTKGVLILDGKMSGEIGPGVCSPFEFSRLFPGFKRAREAFAVMTHALETEIEFPSLPATTEDGQVVTGALTLAVDVVDFERVHGILLRNRAIVTIDDVREDLMHHVSSTFMSFAAKKSSAELTVNEGIREELERALQDALLNITSSRGLAFTALRLPHLAYPESQTGTEVPPVEVVEIRANAGQRMMSAPLDLAMLQSETIPHTTRFTLCSRPSIVFGRDGGSAVANRIVWPPQIEPDTHVNQQLYGAVSRRHGEFRFVDGVLHVLAHRECSYGLKVNGHFLRDDSDGSVEVQTDTLMEFPESYIRCRARVITSTSSRIQSLRERLAPLPDYVQSKGEMLTPDSDSNLGLESKSGIDAVSWSLERNLRQDGSPECNHQLVLIPRLADLGSHSRNAICVAEPGVADLHASIIFMCGRYWLLALQEACPTIVAAPDQELNQGIGLATGQVVELFHGTRIALSEHVFRFLVLQI